MAATNLYVRKTGSDNNGGSSTGTSAQRTGTDGVANGTTTFTSASASFVAGDVDKLINIVTKGRYRITAVTNSTTVTLSGSPASGTGLTWNIGGAVATVGALLQAAAATVVNGDAIWIGAGTYRETISCTNTNTAEVTVNGDVDGAKTGDAGAVRISSWTTSDSAAPSGTTLLNLNAKDFLTFKNIAFEGGTGSTVTGGTDSTDIKFTDCSFFSNQSGNMITGTASFGTALNWTFDRCIFNSYRGSVTTFTATTAAAGSDYDLNVMFRNCLFICPNGTALVVANSGTAASKGNGIHARNCTFLCNSAGSATIISTNSTSLSNTVANTIYNCVCFGGLTANASGGLVTENYNLIFAATPRSNVSAGANSTSDGSKNPLHHFGQERIWGGLLRPYGEPTAGSPLLGFGNTGSPTAYDGYNRPKPAGGASGNGAIGYLERGNTFVTDSSPIGSGGSAIKCTGPAYAEFLVPVPARAITITCKVKWDGTYAGTKPQLQILANGRIGVSAETVTATVAATNIETLTLSSFTPTAAGDMVRIRVISNDTNGGGVLQVDDFTVTG